MIERALAKINLTLDILGRRDDGYHRIRSIVAFADVGERLEASPDRPSGLTITGPRLHGLSATDNLVLAAEAAFRRGFPGAPRLAWRLDKHIPFAAGLGGGSADAAAALRILARQSGIAAGSEPLMAVAAEIGADVPACLVSRAAVMTGIGETVRPLEQMPDLAVVLVNPGIALATADVFRGLGLAPGELSPSGPAGGPAGDPSDDRASLIQALVDGRNDLEPAARRLVPEVASVIEAIGRTDGCLAARMSGSGATCFGLYERLDSAHMAAKHLARIDTAWWVRAAPLGGSGAEAVNATG